MQKKRPHDQRMTAIARQLTPHRLLQNDPILRAAIERNMQMDIAVQQDLKELSEKISLLGFATWGSSSGLRIATELRRFWSEYFDRFMRFGPEKLPSSFNVIEAFMNFSSELSTFVLRPEKEHILSFSHYLDWYTSGSFPEKPGSLIDIMEEGLIYSFDFVLTTDQHLLSADTAKLVVASTALIRHQDELSLLLLAGENPPLEASEPHGVPAPGKEELIPAAEISPEDRFLEGAPEFSRVLLATRFNLSQNTNDVRYLMLDNGSSYTIATDDFEMFRRDLFRDHNEGYTELCKNQLTLLARYADLFSAAAALIYLPAFLIDNAYAIQETEFLTTLGVEAKEPKTKRSRRKLGDSYFKPRRTIRCLPAPFGERGRTSFIVHPPDLEFKAQGFWKPLPLDQIGSGPDGTAVVGKTWVQRTETWQSSSPAEFLARRAQEPAPDSEFIYIMRSPSHAADVYKIGMTKRDVNTRARELTGATSTPLPFETLASWPVVDALKAESKIHQALEGFRLSPRREFFRAPLPTIISKINELLRT